MKFFGKALKKLVNLNSLILSIENCPIKSNGTKKLTEGLECLIKLK